jgi:uncharacterized protein YcbK (DUF882 family)
MIKYFKYGTADKLECSCGCGMRLEEDFLQMIDNAREFSNAPYTINSGARCIAHNRKIGSKDTSTHTTGRAVDIAYTDSIHLVKIIQGLTMAGIKRIGINDNKKFVHADDDKEKAPAVFGY